MRISELNASDQGRSNLPFFAAAGAPACGSFRVLRGGGAAGGAGLRVLGHYVHPVQQVVGRVRLGGGLDVHEGDDGAMPLILLVREHLHTLNLSISEK